MSSTASPTVAPRRRSPVARLVFGRDGRLQTARLLSGVVIAVALISLATFAGLLLAGAGRPEQLAIWVLAGFLLVKVPLLAVLWWILLHRDPEQRSADWSSGECAEITAWLEEQALEAARLPDAALRLEHLAREAWFVADNAADADKPGAAAVAMRIQAMASQARERGRSRPG